MKNSLALEYALHGALLLSALPARKSVSLKQLSRQLGISTTYLAKIFTQLAKAGIVTSSVGSKGGISLAKAPDDISFFDVYLAINGREHMFQCSNVRALSLGYQPSPGMCEIHAAMWEAEQKMFEHMRGTKMSAIAAAVASRFTPEEIGRHLAELAKLGEPEA
ncbi:RrF2 family transcriptional regulator [Paenibacillus ginsengarvi]|uniref:Rrf2 family transcriptional regulator n=1 Tax=Paenibacillus ginsengarvi TaxID=400777 RepID=A0A3B0CFA1_9BACL|nr:Rrf2 family transcriptional regulator [Paenibacillus ginsengarvi]RKN83980.1 Rrf2 family transcriptional regulator [Paenibacillus ginsengarvi]